MDPYNEQRLRDEVIYLHSLWHQGHRTPSPTVNLHPSNSTRFKKPKKKTPKFNARKKNLGNFSGKEWPVKPLPADPPLNQSGWPELKLKPKPQPTRLPTPEELERHNWNKIQQRALISAKEFYSNNSDDDEDDGDEDDDMSEDDDNVENKEYDFFWKLFNGDEELKTYYVKHCGGGGEFSCLVCGGANEKQGKRFKDCIAMVQHSVSIAKTKKRRSHRDYGKVICRVLGWDIDQLPSSIVSDHKSSELQGNDVNVHKDVNNLNNVVDDENSNGRTHDVEETVDGESMVCEDISVVANVEVENNRNQVLNEAEGYTGGAVNSLCRNMASTMVLTAGTSTM
ncbi:hypothetical protein L1987_74104 [Smallanthus sonchifolius]|uniref:Uncharacterized protein n=1 Tax=Smallanthus sonchifolius TaxID=185202 RepID=A0ACB9A3C8_9ASTR|nr:hypothetical protein L1987_74104 [Smallanthus sonchifolius]